MELIKEINIALANYGWYPEDIERRKAALNRVIFLVEVALMELNNEDSNEK